MCVRAHECVLTCLVGVNMCAQRSEDSFVESVLSTFMWLWGIELRSLGWDLVRRETLPAEPGGQPLVLDFK